MPYPMTSVFDFIRRRRGPIIAVAVAVMLLAVCSGCVAYFGYYLPSVEEREARERAAHEYYMKKLALFEEENGLYDDYEVDVAFLGDSLTDGCDLSTYYPDYVTSNRGIGGDTTLKLEDRLDVSLYQLKPKVAVLLIGANNFDTMLSNYEDIIIGIKDNVPQTKLVICSLTSMGGEHWGKNNQKAAYNNVTLSKLAAKHCCPFVDLFSPLFDESIGEIHPEYTTDGGHLTHQGYLVVSGAINPVISKLLSEW